MKSSSSSSSSSSSKPLVTTFQGFLFSTTAPQLAVLFTNPFDTVKVRLQLQNSKQNKVYQNTLDCVTKTIKYEGISGIQRGLSAALLREGSKNLFRLGLFEPILHSIHDKQTEGPMAPAYKRMFAGAVSGAVGAISCNPFELIKTRLQSQSSVSAAAVGYQHQYKGMFQAFGSIVKNEGVVSLFRGSGMSVVRSMLGSAVNLTLYSSMRDYLLVHGLAKDNTWTDITCSLTSALFSVLLMNPVDVLRTRIYNQPYDAVTGKGLLYTNGVDALFKIMKQEGTGALFKGFFPAFLRLGPHFTLTFVFYEQMKRIASDWNQKKLERQTALGDNVTAKV